MLPTRSVRAAGDHPRICGEHPSSIAFSVCGMGSSPHMRGTRLRVVPSVCALGIIPAYAGNTPQAAMIRMVLRDHPRICGEHIGDWIVKHKGPGSSPHMRGTLFARVRLVVISGIIPAYAGNTQTGHSSSSIPWDHPRICGEHQIPVHERVQREGSSPHMRGTLTTVSLLMPIRGIIPAYAGNTLRPFTELVRVRDHPRICGEHRFYRLCRLAAEGSSPHMRGTPTRR